MSEREILEERIKEYKSIIGELYEEIQTYEDWLADAQEELNNLNKDE